MEFKKDKHIIIPVGLAIAAIIAYRSWLDMHPPPLPPQTGFNSYFVVRDNATLNTITGNKDDLHPIAILAGEASISKDKKVSFTPSNVTPTSLPQREIILFYTLSGVLPGPEDTAVDDIASALHASAEKWKEQGDVINDLYIDPLANQSKVAALFAMANPLRASLKKDYWLGLVLDLKSLEALPDMTKQLAETQKSTRTIIFDAKKALKSGETMGDLIMKLDKLDVGFMLRVDDMPDYNGVRQEINDKSKKNPKNFIAFILDPEKLIKSAQ